MKRLQIVSIILTLIDSLKNEGSWCGQTHIQKATYLLQEMTQVPIGFNFILYKHGPFSFDLSDELTAMRAEGLLMVDLKPYQFGTSLCPTEKGYGICKDYQKYTDTYSKNIDFIAKEFSDKGVAELERLSTAFYITKNEDAQDINTRSRLVTTYKPHIPQEKALDALLVVDNMIERARDDFQKQ
jgi:uncharacterized protein YwgA